MGGRSIACLNARDRNLLGLPARPAAPRPRTASTSSCSSTATQPSLGRAHRPADGSVDDRASCARSRGDRRNGEPSTTARPFRAGVAAGLGPAARVEASTPTSSSRRCRFSLDDAPRMALDRRVRRTGLRGRHGGAERRAWRARSAPTSQQLTVPDVVAAAIETGSERGRRPRV